MSSHSNQSQGPVASSIAVEEIVLNVNQLRESRALAADCITLINRAFRALKAAREDMWDCTRPRIPPQEDLGALLGDGSLAAVLLDRAHARPVAFAAATPGKLDFIGFDDSDKSLLQDFEVRLVCVDPSPVYHQRGLAARAVSSLERSIAAQAEAAFHKVQGRIQLHLLSAEELTGGYWKRRGWTLVNEVQAESGIWGSRKPFQMLTYSKVLLLHGERESAAQTIQGG